MSDKHKTLAECRNEIAVKYNFDNWENFSEHCWENRHKNTLGNAIDEAFELYASEENRKQSDPVSGDVETMDAAFDRDYPDDDDADQFVGSLYDVYKKAWESCLQSQQPVSIQWLSDDEIDLKADNISHSMMSMAESIWVPEGFNRGSKWAQTELRKRVNAVDIIEFKNWCDKLSRFHNPECYDYYKSTDSYVVKSNNELLQIYLTSKTK